MKKIINVFILLSFTLVTELLAQYYEGPAAGSVASGLPRNTNDFLMKPYGVPQFLKPPRNLDKVPNLPPPSGFLPFETPPEGSNVMIDPTLVGEKQSLAGDTLLIHFQGFPDQGIYIPPDPIIAVGPTHIIAMVNSRFGIWKKDGTVEKVIEAEPWFNNVYVNSDCFDPKVIYDHFAKRWVMVWLQSSSTTPNTNSNFLVSVSDDSIPLGLWYNYRLPSTTNGNNPANNWADYQGVGYDQNAIYITSNQFQTNSFMYCKIRIIDKSMLYANNGGPVNWYDLWNIVEPYGNPVFGLRPARMRSASSEFYFAVHSRYNPPYANFFTVCKLTNPLTAPSLTILNVPCTAYDSPPDASQLNSSNTIDGGSRNLRNEPVFFNGKLHLVHSVKYGTASSGLHYIAIDVNSNTTTSDIVFGADNFFHTYPALDVDNLGNVVISYTRSATTEYAGAFYTSKNFTSPTLAGSKVLKPGASTYYKTFGGTRNRWGDYNGAWLDPSDNRSIWVFPEYVLSTNMWGTWIGRVQVNAEGVLCKNVDVTTGWNMLAVPVNAVSMNAASLFPTKTSFVYGYNNAYYVADTLVNGKGYWAKFPANESIQVCGTQVISTTVPVSAGWNLIGAYDKNKAVSGITSTPPGIISSNFYGYNNGYFTPDSLYVGKGYWVKVTQNGSLNLPTAVGKSVSFVKSEIDPNWKRIILTDNEGRNFTLYLSKDKINFDRYELPPIPPSGISDVRFGSNRLVEDANLNQVIQLSSLDYPVKIKVEGTILKISDAITKGKLFDKVISEGQEVIINDSKIQAISLQSLELPEEFALSQNYPNPFNPKTKIEYSVPQSVYVTLKVYDILGNELMTLVDESVKSGNHSVEFDASRLSSGVYFYKLKVGDRYLIRKMNLVK